MRQEQIELHGLRHQVGPRSVHGMGSPENNQAEHDIDFCIQDLNQRLDKDIKCILGKGCEKSQFINWERSKLGRVLLNRVRDKPKEREEGLKMGVDCAREVREACLTFEDLCPPSAAVVKYARERQALSGQ